LALRVSKHQKIQWRTKTNANPATPTTRFTKRFKRLVNFLKLRKNMKRPLLSQLCHSEVELWRHFGSVATDGKFK
jgi:hypothetical protein